MNNPLYPIPDLMRNCRIDHRGYAVPDAVFIDKEGRPHFTINDYKKQMQHGIHNECPMCGTPNHRARWFVGGPMSAFHSNGAYLDRPGHHDCIHYAMNVCPWLAAMHYDGAKRIDGKTLPKEERERMTLVDPTQIPTRPKVFVVGRADKVLLKDNGYIVPERPWKDVEFWVHGKMISHEEGHAILHANYDTTEMPFMAKGYVEISKKTRKDSK